MFNIYDYIYHVYYLLFNMFKRHQDGLSL